MRDPRRWRDDRGGQMPGAEVLLRGARRPQPPAPQDLERLGAAVDVIARAPVSAPVSWLRLGVAAAVAFLIVGGGTFVWALRARNERRAAVTAETAALTRATARPKQTAVAMLPPAAPAVRPAPVMPAARPARRRVAEARPAAPAPATAEAATPTDQLAREVPLIDAARGDLATSPSRALASLESHRREFPHGQLAAEREFLAVQALLQMNRLVDAKKRAGELATRYPSSSYAARAGRLIEDVAAQRAAAPARDGSRGAESRPGARAGDRL